MGDWKATVIQDETPITITDEKFENGLSGSVLLRGLLTVQTEAYTLLLPKPCSLSCRPSVAAKNMRNVKQYNLIGCPVRSVENA